MNSYSLATVMKAALIAGLLAGLTVSVFHLVVTEPVIDQAIALEEQHHGAEAPVEAPIVSRRVQKGGMVVGFMVYGLIWSTLLGTTWFTFQRWLPGVARGQRLTLALAAYWAVALFPFLKYPANPPGVGDPESIGYRQALYLAAMTLSILGAVLALYLAHRSNGARPFAARRWGIPLAALGAYSLMVYIVLPGSPDPVEMPASIVDTFRALSVTGLTVFWAILAGLFALLLKDLPQAPPARA